jgi:hypothetical protein
MILSGPTLGAVERSGRAGSQNFEVVGHEGETNDVFAKLALKLFNVFNKLPISPARLLFT